MLWIHVYPGHYPNHFVGPFRNGAELLEEYIGTWRFCEAEAVTDAEKMERLEIEERMNFLGAERKAAPWAYGKSVAIGIDNVAIGYGSVGSAGGGA